MLPYTTVHIATTYACNLACVYCYEGKGTLEQKCMDERGANCSVKFIKDLAEPSSTPLRIGLFGGEPLLNMPINLMIAKELSKWCEEHNKEFHLTALTNGTLSTEKNVEDLAQYDCDFVVNIDGPRNVHDQRRIFKNGKGSFDDIIDGLHRVAEHGLQIVIRVNVDKTNKDRIVPLFEFLKDEGLTDVVLIIKSVFNTSPACSSYSYCMSDIEDQVVVNHLYKIAKAMNFKIGKQTKLSPQGACLAQQASYFTIDPYLRLFKCNLLLPFEKNAVGIIDPESSKPLYNQLYIDFLSRDPLALDECRECTLIPLCRGGCLAEALETKGTTYTHVCRKSGIIKVLEEDLIRFVFG